MNYASINKNTRMECQRFFEPPEPGDILLCNSDKTKIWHSLISKVLDSEYTHVGILARYGGPKKKYTGRLVVIESYTHLSLTTPLGIDLTTDVRHNGVKMVDFELYKKHYSGQLAILKVPKIGGGVDTLNKRILNLFDKYHGREYDLNIFHLINSATKIKDDGPFSGLDTDKFFCSKLVAQILMECGILSLSTVPALVKVSDFVKMNCTNNVPISIPFYI
jgi:hypothetical protein